MPGKAATGSHKLTNPCGNTITLGLMLKQEAPKEELPGENETSCQSDWRGGAFWLAVAAERLWYPVRYLVHQRIK